MTAHEIILGEEGEKDTDQTQSCKGFSRINGCVGNLREKQFCRKRECEDVQRGERRIKRAKPVWISALFALLISHSDFFRDEENR